MKAMFDRKQFLASLSSVGGVIPSRSPKQILQNVLLDVREEGCYLIATDLDIGIRSRLLGVKIDQPGRAILPPGQIGEIFSRSRDSDILMEVVNDQVKVSGVRSRYTLPTEDPDLFPAVPEFEGENYTEVAAADLKTLIRRTHFATDLESTRYALGGVLVELEAGKVKFVATNGRILAIAEAPAEAIGEPGNLLPIVSVKTLKTLDRNIAADDPPVHFYAASNKCNIMFRTDRTTIYARTVEGRFPRYQDVLDWAAENSPTRFTFNAGELREASEQGSITTSEESRGVDYVFRPGVLALAACAADRGDSSVEMPIAYEGPQIEITYDPAYFLPALRAIGDEATITWDILDGKHASTIRTEDGYLYVPMPLKRDR